MLLNFIDILEYYMSRIFDKMENGVKETHCKFSFSYYNFNAALLDIFKNIYLFYGVI